MAGPLDLESPTERLHKAKVELADVAATIDWLYDCPHPSMELIEATRAIHGALNAVGALNASLSDDQSARPPVVGLRPGAGNASLRSEARSWTSTPGSPTISILYDDLLEPINSDDEETPRTGTSEARR